MQIKLKLDFRQFMTREVKNIKQARNKFAYIALCCFALLLGMIVYFSQSIMPAPETSENESVLDEVNHVNIPIYLITQPDMFPAEWLADPINIAATDLPVAEYTRSEKIVRQAMQAYPSHILEDNLTAVYVVGSLSFSNVTAGGTYYINVIYLTNEGLELGYTDRFIEASFHHEFSSILLHNYPSNFADGDWCAANPPDFFYSSGGVDAISMGQASKLLDEALNCAGFLNQYATSSLEEDFNEISESLFMNEIDFWNAVDRYPALRTKVDIAISFYNALDELFTEEYFRSR
jgi:hypothetical protein